MPVGERAENCEGPAVARFFKVADVPVVQVVTVVNVPVIIQRQVLLFQRGGASDSVHRLSRWTFQLCSRDGYDASSRRVLAAMIGFFDAFCVIFRAPPVVPELSASFSSFRALTAVSARGLLAN